MLEVLADALSDSLKILPFVFLIYVLMELIENARSKEKIERALSGYGAPVFASVTGFIPECGFPVMCAKLFDNGLIGIGTLIAAFIASSDEGLVVLISSGVSLREVFLLTAIKISYATLAGMVLNLALKKYRAEHVCPPKDRCVECGERGESMLETVFFHPLYHAAKTFLWILAVTAVLNSAVYFIGEENLYAFLTKSYYVQPLVSAAIGVVPNCASSILIAGSYCGGVMSFSGLVAGLSANAGLGLIVLFRKRESLKRNLVIIFTLYLCSVIIGYLVLIAGVR